jgi:hypothetical protein
MLDKILHDLGLLLIAKGFVVSAGHNAASCGTRRDWEELRRIEGEYEEARDKFEALLAKHIK